MKMKDLSFTEVKSKHVFPLNTLIVLFLHQDRINQQGPNFEHRKHGEQLPYLVITFEPSAI